MSGIFGLLRLDGAPVLAEDLARMSAAMAGYGTEGGGTWSEGGIGLGSRLRYVTAEDALESQPRHQAAGTLVFAGRLDYREDLARALGLSLAELARTPDSALVHAAFERWGEACVDHLAGDWSFALWEPREQRLFLARDHHGNTGLYWHRDGRRLAFATSLKALLALPDIPRRPDLFKVAQILAAWPGDGVRTAHEAIQALPPAHVLVATRSKVETRRTWFPEAAAPLHYRRGEDYLEAFLEVYGAAVGARLRSVRPVGASLSAGLDSGSVVALAGPLLAGEGRGLEAFTAVPRFLDAAALPPQALGNEWELAHATAMMAGVRSHHAVDAAGAGILDSLRRQLEIHDAPGHAGANYHWLLALLELAGTRGLGVLLTGQQGNATVSYAGAASQWWPNLLRGRPEEAWRALRSVEPSPALALKRQVLKPLLLPGLRAWRRRFSPHARPWLQDTALHPAFARELDLERRMRLEGQDPNFESFPEPLNRVLLGLGRITIGATWHELGAASGLDIRDPTADRRVIEFCLRIPEIQLRRGGQDRQLIRRAMAGRLPEAVLRSPLKGLQAADLGHRVLADRPALATALAELSRSPLAAQCLDLPRMGAILSGLDPSTAGTAYSDCGCVVLRGINAGLFLARF